jgi:hypothetical protein
MVTFEDVRHSIGEGRGIAEFREYLACGTIRGPSFLRTVSAPGRREYPYKIKPLK